MDSLHYARAQMGLSLAFHIIFAAIGIGLPFLMVLSELAWRRTKDPEYLELSKLLAKGTTILFAVGAVSGTVLSFELGLLWPNFMGRFGDVIGLPFSLEGYAFFTEAIFLGIFLYGRDRVSPRVHVFSGVVVAVSGAASAFFVTLVNSFMNSPRGFEWVDGKVTNVDPLAAMFGGPWAQQVIHVLLSCYVAVAFAMAGVHALMLLRNKHSSLHRKALRIALPVAVVSGLLQPLSGDRSAKEIAVEQPIKLAAAEGHYQTGRHVPLHLGGLPDDATATMPYALELPSGLSWLAFGDPNAEVKGLTDFPRDQWPPVLATHVSFQVMVASGTTLGGVALLAVFLALVRRRWLLSKPFLAALVATSPLGFIAMEAGWHVTELGRQPWIVRGYLRTGEGVTPFPHLYAPFWVFTIVYALLAVMVVVLLRRQILASAPPKEVRAEGKRPREERPAP